MEWGVWGISPTRTPYPLLREGKECALLVWGSGDRRGRESWGELGCSGYPEHFLEEASSGKAECEMLRGRVGQAWEEKVGGPRVARVERGFGGLGPGEVCQTGETGQGHNSGELPAGCRERVGRDAPGQNVPRT